MKLKRYAALLMVVMISVVSVAGCDRTYDDEDETVEETDEEESAETSADETNQGSNLIKNSLNRDKTENSNYIVGESKDYEFYDDRAYVEFDEVMPAETVTIEDIDSTIILWLNATYAVQTRTNNLDTSIIGGSDDRFSLEYVLEDGWGIEDRESFIETYNKLITYGHRGKYLEYVNEMMLDGIMDQHGKDAERFMNTIKEHYTDDDEETITRRWYAAEYYLREGSHFLDAWDYTRAINILGCAYVAGYITFDEYMEHAVPVANLIKESYSDWDAVWNHYVVGYQYWKKSDPNTDMELRRRIQEYDNLMAGADMLIAVPYDYDITFDREVIYANQDQARKEMDKDSEFNKNGYVCSAEPNIFYEYDFDIDGKSIPAKIMFSAIKPDRNIRFSNEDKNLLLTIVVNGDGPSEETIREKIVVTDYYNTEYSYGTLKQDLSEYGSTTFYGKNAKGNTESYSMTAHLVVEGRTKEATVYIFNIAMNTPKGDENAVIGFIPGFKYPKDENQGSFADYYSDDSLLLRLSNDTIIKCSTNQIEVDADMSYTILKGIKSDFNSFVDHYGNPMHHYADKDMNSVLEGDEIDDAYNWTFLLYNPMHIRQFDEDTKIRDKIMRDLLAEKLVLPEDKNIPVMTDAK